MQTTIASDPIVGHVRRAMKSSSRKQLAAELQKAAAATGGEPVASFERSFAGLAYTYIQDKAPGLMDYLVGFQLVERSSDNKKAIGIFGFKVGDQWLYVPAVFLYGKLRGHEMLYLKGADKFVPLKEKWVNYITSRKQRSLGHGANGTLQQLGEQAPDLLAFSQPPLSGRKFGTEVKAWAREAGLFQDLAKIVTSLQPLMEIEYLQTRNSKFATDLLPRYDLPGLLAGSLACVKAAVDLCQQFPAVRDALFRFHGRDVLSRSFYAACEAERAKQAAALRNPSLFTQRATAATKAAAEGHCSAVGRRAAKKRPQRKTAWPSDRVQIYTQQDDVRHLTDDEKSLILSQGYVVRDQRRAEEVSKLYDTQDSKAFTNPSETGIYRVLTRSNELLKCLVLVGSHGDERELRTVTIPLEGDKAGYINTANSELFVASVDAEGDAVTDYRKWFADAASTAKLSELAKYVCVTPTGSGTAVFTVMKDMGDDCYEVSFDSDTPSVVGQARLPRAGTSAPTTYICRYLRFNQRDGTQLRQVTDTLYIPRSAKTIEVSPPAKCASCGRTKVECTCDYFMQDYQRVPSPIQPGGLVDISLELWQKKAGLKVIVDQSDVYIGSSRQPLTKLAALSQLICQVGLRESQAKSILKQAAACGGRRFLVRYAAPYSMMDGSGITAPTFPEPPEYSDPGWGSVPVQSPYEQQAPVDALRAANTDPNTYDAMRPLDPQLVASAQQASQSGQRELFDTATFAALAKSTGIDSLLERHTGSFMSTVDGLGRMLLAFYWHNDEFEERYGKKDMPELEDTLISNFGSMGDLVLYLKEKTIDPLQSDMSQPTLTA